MASNSSLNSDYGVTWGPKKNTTPTVATPVVTAPTVTTPVTSGPPAPKTTTSTANTGWTTVQPTVPNSVAATPADASNTYATNIATLAAKKAAEEAAAKKAEEEAAAKKKADENALFEGMWGNFMNNFASQYITKPTTSTADLSTYTQTIQNQLQPVLDTQITNLAAQRKQAKKDAENDLARRGFFGQLPSVEVLDKVNSEYDNSEANLRANFLSNVLNQAFPLYSQGLSQDAAAKSSYNQNMLNLGLAVMNGMIDQNKFIADDAYRKAALAKLAGEDVTSLFGTIGASQNK